MIQVTKKNDKNDYGKCYENGILAKNNELYGNDDLGTLMNTINQMNPKKEPMNKNFKVKEFKIKLTSRLLSKLGGIMKNSKIATSPRLPVSNTEVYTKVRAVRGINSITEKLITLEDVLVAAEVTECFRKTRRKKKITEKNGTCCL